MELRKLVEKLTFVSKSKKGTKQVDKEEDNQYSNLARKENRRNASSCSMIWLNECMFSGVQSQHFGFIFVYKNKTKILLLLYRIFFFRHF